jgi:hypothetical protein
MGPALVALAEPRSPVYAMLLMTLPMNHLMHAYSLRNEE